MHATVPLVQEKIETFSQYPDFVRFLFEDVTADGADPRICRAAAERSRDVEPWEATRLEEALRALADELGEKPRTAFQPIRLAITGSKISPGPLREHGAARQRASRSPGSKAAAASRLGPVDDDRRADGQHAGGPHRPGARWRRRPTNATAPTEREQERGQRTPGPS